MTIFELNQENIGDHETEKEEQCLVFDEKIQEKYQPQKEEDEQEFVRSHIRHQIDKT